MLIVIQDNVGKKYTSEGQLNALGFSNLELHGATASQAFSVFSIYNTPRENKIGLDYNEAFLEQALGTLPDTYTLVIQDETTLYWIRAITKLLHEHNQSQRQVQKFVYDGKLYHIDCDGRFCENMPFHEPFFSIEMLAMKLLATPRKAKQ